MRDCTLLKHTEAEGESYLELSFMEDCHFHGHEPGNVFCVSYMDYRGLEEGRKCFDVCNTQYFAVERFEAALSCFRRRKESSNPCAPTEREGSLDEALPKKKRMKA